MNQKVACSIIAMVKFGGVLPKCTTNSSVPGLALALHFAVSPNSFSFRGGGRARSVIYSSSNPSLPLPFGGIFFSPSKRRRRKEQGSSAARASKSDVPSTFRYPPMKRKPRWWWRMLSSIPYLMPLHQTWVFSETAYHIHPFLEDLEFCTYPFLQAIGSRLPAWFPMAYFFIAYLAVVRRKEWPHFFRFHVIMGMLLEISLQVVGMTWRFLPRSVYWGKIGMHFWAAFTFGYLFTVIECLMCALGGMYADVPFLSDAAYAQIPYD